MCFAVDFVDCNAFVEHAAGEFRFVLYCNILYFYTLKRLKDYKTIIEL